MEVRGVSDRVLSKPDTVHVRAHSRGGARGPVPVSAHDRSRPDGERAYLAPENVAKAPKKMQDYLTFFRQNAARDKAEGVDKGWQLAIDNLEHSLDGSGKPVTLTSEQVAQMPALVEAEEDARTQFEKTFTANTKNLELNSSLFNLADGQVLEFRDFWDTSTEIRMHRTSDYAAIGQSSVHSDGGFRAERSGDLIKIEGEVAHRLGAADPSRPDYYRDPFDFQGGQPGSFPAITLEDAGQAKRFDMLSEPRGQSVSVNVRVQPDGRLTLEGPPVWGPTR